MEGYVQFDRFTDLETSLEQLLEQIHKEPMTATSWKWTLISAHSALQGAVCIALRGSAGFDTWKRKHLKRWLEAYENGKELPDPHLDFFMELFDRLFDSNSGIDRNMIFWLNETRNGLVHFNTDSYSVERASIVSAVNEAVAATIAAAGRSRGVFFYEEWQSDRFRSLCASICASLPRLAAA